MHSALGTQLASLVFYHHYSVWVWCAILGAGLLAGYLGAFLVRWLPEHMQRQWLQEEAEIKGETYVEPDRVSLLPTAALTGLQKAFIQGSIALNFLICFHYWTNPLTAVLWSVFFGTCIVLAWIDTRTQLLPDDLVLPLLWLGILAASMGLTETTLHSSIWGAALGYMVLWLVYQAYKMATKVEGMGFGDFKLLACIGAWMGWEMLLPVLLIASLGATIFGISAKFVLKDKADPKHLSFAFGPFLVYGAMLQMMMVGLNLVPI
jgi:prepilin signal peptidase PulO-like enzyme (type II secretory pathway)